MKADILRFLLICLLLSAISANFLKGRKKKGMSGGKKSKKSKGGNGDKEMMFDIDLKNEENYEEMLTPQTGDPNAGIGRTGRYIGTGAIMKDGEVVGSKLLTMTYAYVGDKPYYFAEAEYFWDGPEGGSISAKTAWSDFDEDTAMLSLGVVGTTGKWAEYKNVGITVHFSEDEEQIAIHWD
eukprot:CAMPEP_0182420424 /NCGR_PEP_ID=MMETSP1167-20130531/5217_1 /TAXON_ID=2988 /ORGANISM="Mallomonas Sp, Strain CCMP3275" /LENGTH=180 /DNA_ID=CAMNT_0024596351 /DNA_START=84 /DNA_END=626 /DNA_ORIENTATION=-